MSTIIMSLCWPLVVPPVAKAVLISLADQANDAGVAWPSVATLCRRTCYGERAVRNALRALEEMGLLSVRLSPRSSSVYTISVKACRALAAANRSACADDEVDGAESTRHHVPDMGESRGHDVPHNDAQPGTTCRPDRHHVPPNHHRTNTNTTPLPPDGGDGPFASRESVQTSALQPLVRFGHWLDECRRSGVSPIAEDHPVWAYADQIGLPEEFVRLHWWEFKRRHGRSDRRHRDWGAKFMAGVEGNAYRFWYAGADRAFALSTQGLQAMLAKGGE